MKKLLLASLLLLSIGAGAQNVNQQVIDLFQADKPDEAVRLALDNYATLNDSALLNAGTAALMLSRDTLARYFFNTCTERFPSYGFGWYIRSMFHSSMKEADSCRYAIDKALALEPKNPDFWISKGNLFDNLEQYDSALVMYRTALLFDDCPKAVHCNIGDELYELNRYHEAAESYRTAMKVLPSSDEDYLRAEYNLGACYYRTEDYNRSEKLLMDILIKHPTYYKAVEKLIQVYYKEKKYKEAAQLKSTLYKAHEAGNLPKSLEEDFCFDEFKWREKTVYVYERYDESGALYYKHVFYVVNADNKIDMQVQTEHSAAISHAGKKYVLGMDKGKKHYTYINYMYSAEPDYEDLKMGVLDVLEGRAKASSSSTRN